MRRYVVNPATGATTPTVSTGVAGLNLVDAAFDPITRTISFGSGNTTARTTALIVMMIAIAAVAIRRVS